MGDTTPDEEIQTISWQVESFTPIKPAELTEVTSVENDESEEKLPVKSDELSETLVVEEIEKELPIELDIQVEASATDSDVEESPSDLSSDITQLEPPPVLPLPVEEISEIPVAVTSSVDKSPDNVTGFSIKSWEEYLAVNACTNFIACTTAC